MQIDRLILKDYRNIKYLDINFNSNINVFYGLNGQGKTNIVESIYFLAKSQSFKTSYVNQLIKDNSNMAIVEGNFTCSKQKTNQKIIVNNLHKACFLNNKQVSKTSEYLENANAICFSPVDVTLLKDSPSTRRKFLDSELSSLFPQYVKQLILAKKYLEQRNDLLKVKDIDRNLLEILDNKLSETSFDVYKKRKWMINAFNKIANQIYENLSDKKDVLKVEYKTFLENDNKEEYINQSCKILLDNLDKDITRQYSNIGIHKDDFKVYLNDKDCSMYASQGQSRLVSLVLKLAVFEIVSTLNKDEPILILDDAFSELDLIKKDKLLEYIRNKQQVFITCTDYRKIISSKATLYKIVDGTLKERNVI